IDRVACFAGGSPFAHAVKVLECETQRVHLSVTNRARGIRAVLLHPLAHRENSAVGRGFLQRRNVRWRWWRRRAKDVRQQPLSADRWRRSVCIGSYSQDTALAQQSSPLVMTIQRYAPKVAAIDIGNSIKPRQ